MKRIKKRIFLFWPYLFVLLFLFTGCEWELKDDFQTQTPSTTTHETFEVKKWNKPIGENVALQTFITMEHYGKAPLPWGDLK